MLLERGHVAHDALVQEMRHAPLERLLDVRAGNVDQVTQVFEDGSGKVRGLRNVGVDTRIS